MLALAFFLFVCAGLFEVVAISQSGFACDERADWQLVLTFSAPALWLGGIVSLYLATRDRTLRGGRWTGVGGLAAMVIGLLLLPTLASPISGCFS